MHKTIKNIKALPTAQFEIVQRLSSNYAPELASSLSTKTSTVTTAIGSSKDYSAPDQRYGSGRSSAPKPASDTSGVPFFQSSDPVVFTEEESTRFKYNKTKDIASLGFADSKNEYSKAEIDMILHSLKHTHDSRIECMNHLQRLVQLCIGESPSQRIEQRNRKIWTDHKTEILLALYDCLDDEEGRSLPNAAEVPETKQYTLVLLKEIIEYDPDLFADNLQEFVGILIEHYNDEVSVCELADEVLVALANNQDRVSLLLIMCPLVSAEEPPALQALIRVMKYIISGCSKYELDPILNALTPPLVTTFNHPHANVRKSVVFCLVELYFVIGDSFEA